MPALMGSARLHPSGWIGSRATKRSEIAIAVCSGQRLGGVSAMLRARLSVASDFGNPANLRASSHGSFPARANTETRLKVNAIRLGSDRCKEEFVESDCRKAKASVLGMVISHDGMKSCRIWCAWRSI